MRITFVLPELMAHPSGGARVVYEYANGLAERGHQVTVVHPRTLFFAGLATGWMAECRQRARGIRTLLQTGVTKVRPVAVGWQKMHPQVRLLSIPTAHARYLPEGDAVIATFWRTAEYVAGYPARCGAGFYLIQHHETNMGPPARVNGTWLLPLRKIVIARWLMETGRTLGAKDLHHVPNAIDHRNFYLSRPMEGRPLKVAMLYSPLEWKGSGEGIEALTQVKQLFPSLGAVLFGTGPRPEGLPDWMEYYRNPAQDVLRDVIYNGSAIYLCSSWSEGWGLPVTEAMACGCAIVTTDNGGVGDFVEHGITGVMVPPRDTRAMSQALGALLADPVKREGVAKAGQQGAQAFTYARSLALLEGVLTTPLRGGV